MIRGVRRRYSSLPLPLRLGVRRALAAGLRVLHPGGLSFYVGGRRIRVSFSSLNHYREIKHFHEYEREFLDAFIGYSRKSKVVVDIGAHIGLYSVTAAVSGARVIAFEPEPKNASVLVKTASQNGLAVELRQMCLGEANGSVRLSIKGDTGSFVSRGEDSRATVHVPVRTLDELVASGDVPAPDLVKIDVEGYEAAVLRGMANVLQKHSPVVLVEIHPDFLGAYGESADGVRGFMTDHGYDTVLLRAPGIGSPTQHRQTHAAFLPAAGGTE